MKMMTILFLLMTGFCAEAAPVRQVILNEGEMTQVYVSPRFSTLIKFDAHPEPGLIGDQDAFKVEYMRNMVAIKPLVSKGKTNLFIFTKEGQFNFQLIATPEHHDNIVYVQRKHAPTPQVPPERKVTMIDDLFTRRIGKSARSKNATLKIENVATPSSRSTLLIRFQVETKGKEKLGRSQILIRQSRTSLLPENIYFERIKEPGKGETVKGLVLLRASLIAKKIPLEFCLLPQNGKATESCEISVSFNADL